MVEAKSWNAVGARFKSFNFIQENSPSNPLKATTKNVKQGRKMSVFSFLKAVFDFGME